MSTQEHCLKVIVEESPQLHRRIAQLEKQLETTSNQLRRWTNESRCGGWSTHQCEPMRRHADQIDETLFKRP